MKRRLISLGKQKNFAPFTKKPNYDNLTGREQKSLNNQIEAMIDSKYSFVHIDGLNKNQLDSMIKSKKFDNKLLIVDEVHNIKDSGKKKLPVLLKKVLEYAINLKLVLLSATPMFDKASDIVDIINYVMYEVGQPMHAYDADKVKGEITVRFAKKNESCLILKN